MQHPGKILIIQTASIGDVILATPLIESLWLNFPESKIDFLLKKGNESLFNGHPYLHNVISWDKKRSKYKNLFQLLILIRRSRYDLILNLQRFASTGLITALSGAGLKVGYDKNPFSGLFHYKIKHIIHKGTLHEVDRNLKLLTSINITVVRSVKLYPSDADYRLAGKYDLPPYICLAPASLWFTKQYPEEKWVDFVKKVPVTIKIYLVGAQNDSELCQRIISQSGCRNATNLAGKLSFLQTAALMQKARMNYVNDSAPLHLASSVNAPVTAIFCSTVPDYGFGPLSENSSVIETKEHLTCRPCGLHGLNQCPEIHFKCARTIDTDELLNRL